MAQKWEAFRLTALESMSGADAALTLGMKVATVFTAKSKVQKLVREEIQRLETGSLPAHAPSLPEPGLPDEPA
jgi:RNA polymerase sigma-70 factor (ECF subfamily)